MSVVSLASRHRSDCAAYHAARRSPSNRCACIASIRATSACRLAPCKSSHHCGTVARMRRGGMA